MDARFALICAVLANINRDTKKKPIPYSVKDFMPKAKPTHKDIKNKVAQLMNYVRVIDGV